MSFTESIPQRSVRIWQGDKTAFDEIASFCEVLGREVEILHDGSEMIIRGGHLPTVGIPLGIDPVNACVMQFMAVLGQHWRFVPICKTLFDKTKVLWDDAAKQAKQEAKAKRKVEQAKVKKIEDAQLDLFEANR